MEDIRWKQRFDNFSRAFANFSSGIQLANERKLSDLEEQGVIQSFEYTHELAWKVLKDYLEEQGFKGIIGSKNATRIALSTPNHLFCRLLYGRHSRNNNNFPLQ
jgi:hypothetical protein